MRSLLLGMAAGAGVAMLATYAVKLITPDGESSMDIADDTSSRRAFADFFRILI